MTQPPFLFGADDERQGIERLQAAIAGRYTLEGEAGRGGMAVVYRARDLRHSRVVAFKALRPHFSLNGLTRFRREIALAANLQHPHIVPVFDSGESDGWLWYTMPFIDGESLRQRLRREARVGVAETVRLLREITDALAYAHDQGVVHRDLKPDNVLLSRGHAMVTDFGVAKALAAATAGDASPDAMSESRTAVGVTVGTPAYMAPEQAAADPAVDHRADLYALGVLAYELLAGEPPFANRGPSALLVAHAAEVPAPLDTRCQDLPAALSAVVMRLLAKPPKDRPASAQNVIVVLDSISSDLAGRRGRVSAVKAVVAAAVVVAVGVGAAALWYRRTPADAEPRNGGPRRVLVVPLEDLTRDSTLAPLARIAGTMIEQGLARAASIQVTLAAPDPRLPGEAGLKALAAANSAETVVSGSYSLDGDSIRFQPRVIRVDNWTPMRALEQESAHRSSPTTALRPIAQRILGLFSTARDSALGLLGTGLAEAPTLEASELYLAAQELIDAGNWPDAIPYLLRAARADSTWPFPLLSAIDGYFGTGHIRTADSLHRILEPRRASLRPEYRGMLDRQRGSIDGDAVAALKGAQATVRALPGGSLAHFLHGVTAVAANHPREAIETLGHVSTPYKNTRGSSIAQGYWQIVTEALHMLGQYGEELAAARAGSQINPENRLALWCELRALASNGRVDEFRSRLDALEEMGSDAIPATIGGTEIQAAGTTAQLLFRLANELEAHGDSAESRRTLTRALAWLRTRRDADQRSLIGRYDLAEGLYLLGDLDAAQPLIARLAAQQPTTTVFITMQGLVAARRGLRMDAERAVERLAALEDRFDLGRTVYARAQIAARLGDSAESIRLLQQIALRRAPYSEFGNALHADPELASLRRNPAFLKLVAPKG